MQRIRTVAIYSEEDRFDFSGTARFDEANGYRSTSFLTIPMVNNEQEVTGILQLINARDRKTDAIVAFPEDLAEVVEAYAGWKAAYAI